MTFVKQGAATGKHHDDGPPRLNSSRCGDHYNAASGLNQSLCDASKAVKEKPGARMSQELIQKNSDKDIELSVIEQVVMQGDLSKLNPEQRVVYYRKVCESAGLNPFTRPFDYIMLNGKLTLYAKKDCTEQLRKLNGVSIEALEDKMVDDIYIVTATARDKSGRTDQSKGAVTLGNLKGDAKANAIMKAETKAKRRVTLSISGLGWVDETEIDSISNAKKAEVDLSTGEIKTKFVQNAVVENKPKLTQSQAEELYMILDECDDKYRTWVFDYVKKTFNGDLTTVPSDMYERMKAAALKNVMDNHAKQFLGVQPEVVTAAEIL